MEKTADVIIIGGGVIGLGTGYYLAPKKRREESFYGFSGYGFQPSPALGKVISELIVDGRTSTNDISSLLIERFKTGQGMLEPLTAFKK